MQDYCATNPRIPFHFIQATSWCRIFFQGIYEFTQVFVCVVDTIEQALRDLLYFRLSVKTEFPVRFSFQIPENSRFFSKNKPAAAKAARLLPSINGWLLDIP
jgi:hypothetical protein